MKMTILEEMLKGGGGRRLVLFPVPLQGHINPMLELANILYYRSGFSITILHYPFNSPNPENYPNFTFLPISESLSEPEPSTSDLIAFHTFISTRFINPLKDCLTQLLSKDPIACLISDALLFFTGAVAESIKLPRIVLRTGGVSSFVAFAAFPNLLEKGYFPIHDSRLNDIVPELPPLRFKDLPTYSTDDPNKLYKILAGMVDGAKASRGIIWNSFEELEQPALNKLRHDFKVPIFPIGPFHKHFPSASCSSSLLEQDQSSISWLDKQLPKSVVYVSFGSIAAMDKDEFHEIALGLADSNQPFLWVIRPQLVHGSEWLEMLPNGYLEMLNGRAHIVKWAPQVEVLAHPAVGAFWTHNGWNSTMESICEGVPMICKPSFTDQLVNARYVTHVWEVGVQLEDGFEKESVSRAIRRIMEKDGEEIRERMLHLKEKARVCLEKGGSSYEALESLINFVSSL